LTALDTSVPPYIRFSFKLRREKSWRGTCRLTFFLKSSTCCSPPSPRYAARIMVDFTQYILCPRCQFFLPFFLVHFSSLSTVLFFIFSIEDFASGSTLNFQTFPIFVFCCLPPVILFSFPNFRYLAAFLHFGIGRNR